jgi:Dynein light intermediate chain (DLIC)
MTTEAISRLDTILLMFEMMPMKVQRMKLVVNLAHSFLSDILARLSVYTVPSASTSYTALLPHFLPPRQSVPHTLVMIVLDWTRPWTFVEELQRWLEWVETWAKGDESRELQIVREENRERRQYEEFSDPMLFIITLIHMQCSRTFSIMPNLRPTPYPPTPPFQILFYLLDLAHLHIILLECLSLWHVQRLI